MDFPLNLLILRALSRGPNHGFGIAQFIRSASGGLLSVEEGSLYPALHRLERDKLVSAGWKVTENARRARYYRLTAAGAKSLEQAERSWSVMAEGISNILRFA
jgi:PadR family transcriptional regulator PadR